MKSEQLLKKSIGGVLLSKRVNMGKGEVVVTQADIAFEAGISTRYYGKIERGEAMPTLYVLMRLAEVFEIQISDLCKQIEEY